MKKSATTAISSIRYTNPVRSRHRPGGHFRMQGEKRGTGAGRQPCRTSRSYARGRVASCRQPRHLPNHRGRRKSRELRRTCRKRFGARDGERSAQEPHWRSARMYDGSYLSLPLLYTRSVRHRALRTATFRYIIAPHPETQMRRSHEHCYKEPPSITRKGG